MDKHYQQTTNEKKTEKSQQSINEKDKNESEITTTKDLQMERSVSGGSL
jgi:hypothetical protein